METRGLVPGMWSRGSRAIPLGISLTTEGGGRGGFFIIRTEGNYSRGRIGKNDSSEPRLIGIKASPEVQKSKELLHKIGYFSLTLGKGGSFREVVDHQGRPLIKTGNSLRRTFDERERGHEKGLLGETFLFFLEGQKVSGHGDYKPGETQSLPMQRCRKRGR